MSDKVSGNFLSLSLQVILKLSLTPLEVRDKGQGDELGVRHRLRGRMLIREEVRWGQAPAGGMMRRMTGDRGMNKTSPFVP